MVVKGLNMSDSKETRRFPEPGGDTGKTRVVPRGDDLVPGRKVPPTTLVGRPSTKEPSDHEVSHDLVVGWLVVVAGPGRGNFAPIYDGGNSIGRDPDQRIRLNFGDETISRSAHAYISYDYMERRFSIRDGGKSNLVRLNKTPVLQPVELKTGDRVSIGRTEFAFVGFCGPDFDWQEA